MPLSMLAAVPDPLATWGQIAAIILAVELLIFVLLGLALSLLLMFAFAWMREKVELIKRLRPTIDSLNQALEAEAAERPLAMPQAENPLVRGVAQVPTRLRALDRRVEQGSERVASVVIEFRARTLMVRQMARAFFLPGSLRPEQRRLAGASEEARSALAGERVAPAAPEAPVAEAQRPPAAVQFAQQTHHASAR
jgi:hypothetical protein